MVPPELNRARRRQTFGVPILIVYWPDRDFARDHRRAWPTDTGEELMETIGQPCSHMEVSIRASGRQHRVRGRRAGRDLHARLQHDGGL